MPLYEYECRECGERFERIQRVADAPVTACPRCGGAVHRLIGVPALQFKGSGWYVTDYAKGNGRDSKPATPDAGGGTADTATPKASETKAESGGSKATTD